MRLRRPLSKVNSGLRVVSENFTHFLFNFRGPLVVKLESLKVFFYLRKFSESKKASGYISICEDPSKS